MNEEQEDRVLALARETIDVPIGAVLPFDRLPYQTEHSRLRIPIPGPMRNFARDGIPLEISPFTGVPRLVPSISFMTFERCTEGWQRIE